MQKNMRRSWKENFGFYQEIPFSRISVLNYVDQDLRVLVNKDYEVVKHSSVEYNCFIIINNCS